MTNQQCTLAVDMGTTAIKVLAYDRAGTEIARAAQPVELIHDDEGAAEQDPQAVYEAIMSAMIAACHAARERGYTIGCVGVSAAMHSLIPVREDGTPLMRAMTWADIRAQQQADSLWNTPVGKALYERTGTPIHAMSPLVKLLWLRSARPQVFAESARFVSLAEWMWYRWFGGWQVSASIASATGLYNLHDRTWDAEALRVANITAGQLSNILPTTFVRTGCAEPRLSDVGIDASVAFNIGASDGVLANLGAGAIDDDLMVLTIGTSLAVRVGSRTPVTDVRTRSFCYVLDDDRFILGGPGNNGGIVLDWLYHRVFHGSTEPLHGRHTAEEDARFNAALASAEHAAADGLVFLPYISGERAPLWTGDATGVILGLRIHHTGADMLRAGVEGILFNAYWIASQLFEQTRRPRAIVASGGVLETPWIRALTADIFGIPVLDIGTIDTSGAGAAALANIATGIWTWDDALKQHAGLHETVIPAAPGAYTAKFARFKGLAEVLTTELGDIYFQRSSQQSR